MRPESRTATAFAERRLSTVRSARAEERERPADWDDPAFHRDGPEEEYEEEPFRPRTVRGVLVGGARLVGILAFPAVRVRGAVAPFD